MKSNRDNPLVSIIMPSFNQVQFIETAIRSIFDQDYNKVELIVIDGLSTDGTQNLLLSLQREYGKRFRWYSEKDSGPAQAINRGLRQASGEIIGWLNSDDIYSSSAIHRAISHFLNKNDHVLVYGLANYVDEFGSLIKQYPSKPPSSSLDDFANGCFVCQPTIFVRREAIDQVGFLDESLKTAFDFDWWLRFFKRYSGRIGFIRRIQAYSRIHPSCITNRERQNVALEGMKVLSRHLSIVPVNWFWTHIDELCNQYPFSNDTRPLLAQVQSFFEIANKYYGIEQIKEMGKRLKLDQRIALSKPNLMILLETDGWVSKNLIVKYRWNQNPAKAISVRCLANWPSKEIMNLKILTTNGNTQVTKFKIPNEFVLRLEVPPANQAGLTVWQISTPQFFVPARHNKKSSDKRQLSFRVLETILEA